ncbi:MAG TPA: CheB methylesterase domain-containing protein, partial [Magnetospirillum sp.]|nr:CheB methylesterase domain-containing protein [Magnetospirillum sp.]
PAGERLSAVPPMAGVDVVAIVASTGGPGALARVLGCLPKNFSVPVVVVQHMGEPFLAGFAHWLSSVSVLPVTLAGEGKRAEPGHVYVSPGDVHLAMSGHIMHLLSTPPVNAQRPSGDVLFQSLAEGNGPRAIGVLLTGMGEDGAHGLLALRLAGGHTIAEDRSTAIIWGMPGAAVALGAAGEVLPVDAIAGRLRQLAPPAAALQVRP